MDQEKNYQIVTRRVKVTDKKTGTQYIEERQYRYDPKKGHNVVISSRRTGEKILKGSSEVVRCRPKKKAASAEAGEAQGTEFKAKRTRVGATDLLRHAGNISGLDAAVRKAYPDGGTGEKLLSVAQYLVASGETVHNVEAWQCQHDLPYEEGLSEDICYNLFDELGADESGMQSLFKALADLAEKDQQQVIAFDSTSHSVYGDGLKPFARQGFNKDGDGLDIYKIITFLSLDTGLPVSFELQPGNIPDVTSLLNALTRAQVYGLKNPEFCLDNGFFSKGNILKFLRSNMKFTILATLKDAWIYRHLDEPDSEGACLRDKFKQFASQCPFDLTTSAVSAMVMTPFSWKRERSRNGVPAGTIESKTFRLYYHYFWNKQRAIAEETAFSKKLHDMQGLIASGEAIPEDKIDFAKTYFTWKRVRGGKISVTPNEAAIAEAQKDFGVFAILTNLHASPWDALKRYRRRNDIEQSYRVIKSDLDGRKPRVWTPTSTRGKEVCRHIALGYKFVLQRLLEKTTAEAQRRAKDPSLTKGEQKKYGRVAAWSSQLSIKQMLDWFDCIERVDVCNKVAKRRWSTESTERDRAFLDLFRDEARWV